jgi:hypothetical protein
VLPAANVVGRVVAVTFAAVAAGTLTVVEVTLPATPATVVDVEPLAGAGTDDDVTAVEDPLDTVVGETVEPAVLSAVAVTVVAGDTGEAADAADEGAADEGAAEEGAADAGGVAAGAADEGAGASDAGFGDVVSAASAGAAAMVAVATIELIVNRVLRDMLSTSAGS